MSAPEFAAAAAREELVTAALRVLSAERGPEGPHRASEIEYADDMLDEAAKALAAVLDGDAAAWAVRRVDQAARAWVAHMAGSRDVLSGPALALAEAVEATAGTGTGDRFRERVEAVLSPYYGALTQTAIDHITDKITGGAR